MNLVIIDSGGANIGSIRYACERLRVTPTLTRDKTVIQAASHVILPGVGHAEAAMQRLQAYDLITTIRELTMPVLGICLGMQLLCRHSAEGDVDTLNIIDMPVEPFHPTPLLRVPHMGWNQCRIVNAHPNFEGLPEQAHFYFVHSYYVPVGAHTIGSTEYGIPFSAVIARRNFVATQFHPERS